MHDVPVDIGGTSMNATEGWLTIICIVIGIVAIVAIISIGTRMQESVQARLGSLGADLITVTPGFSRAAGDFEGFRSAGGGGINLTDREVNDLLPKKKGYR